MQFGKNQPISEGDKSVDKADLYSLYRMVTLKIRQKLINSFIQFPQNMKIGQQNPTLSSSNSVQTRYLSKMYKSDLENKVKVTKICKPPLHTTLVSVVSLWWVQLF